MKKGLAILLLLCLLGRQSNAQEAKTENPKLAAVKDYMFHKQMVGGVRLLSTGLGFYLEYGIIKNIYKTHLFLLEYEWHLDYRDKTTKAQPYYSESGRDYFFGVQNKFHTIRFSYGFEKAIADKYIRNGVRLSWVGFAGVAMGLVKPYYLNLQYPTPVGSELPIDVRSEQYSAANASVFLDKTRIDEAAPIYKGLDQIKPVFGGHLQSGLTFDWGTKDAFVFSIEAGASLDIYYKRIPIYINNDANNFLFFGLYIAVHIGKRW